MNTKSFITSLLGLAVTAAMLFSLPACNKDKKDDKTPETSEELTYDDLATFQEAICTIDTLGQLVHYNVGAILYESEPEHLYIGVDDIEQAALMFRNWIAADIDLGTIDANVKDLTANLTDAQGKSQGTIYFKAGNGSTVAEVTAGAGTQLKYVDKITFLLNSAWPYNSGENIWHIGDILAFTPTGDCGEGLTSEDRTLNFVLIREASNGVKPLWCAITKRGYEAVSYNSTDHTDGYYIWKSSYCPSMGTAKEIGNILQSDWDFFVSRFEEAGCGELDNSFHWTTSKHDNNWAWYWDVLRLSDNYSYGVRKGNTFTFLLKIDWMEDGKIFIKATDGSAGYGGEGYANLFDSNGGTKWCTHKREQSASIQGDRQCWFVEFEMDEIITPTGYSMTTAGDTKDYDKRNPKEWYLYGKRRARDKEWTLIDGRAPTGYGEFAYLQPDNYKKTEYTSLNGTTGEYQYFRLEVLETWGAETFQISEFELIY